VVFLAVPAALLVIAQLLPFWTIPVIAVCSLLGVTVIGALQLRHDNRLSERGFLQLMMKTAGRLPGVLTGRGARIGSGPMSERGSG
jgi:hypothetical protein